MAHCGTIASVTHIQYYVYTGMGQGAQRQTCALPKNIMQCTGLCIEDTYVKLQWKETMCTSLSA